MNSERVKNILAYFGTGLLGDGLMIIGAYSLANQGSVEGMFFVSGLVIGIVSVIGLLTTKGESNVIPGPQTDELSRLK